MKLNKYSIRLRKGVKSLDGEENASTLIDTQKFIFIVTIMNNDLCDTTE